MKKQRKCLDCGEALSGRRDKKFCSDSCRINYHNQKNTLTNREIRSIYAILMRNRNILVKLWEEGIRITDQQKLIISGFNFTYHTHVHQNGRSVILGVFDYSLHLMKGTRITITCTTTAKPSSLAKKTYL